MLITSKQPKSQIKPLHEKPKLKLGVSHRKGK